MLHEEVIDQTLLLGCTQRSRPSNQVAAMLHDKVMDQTLLLGCVQRSRPSNQAAAMLHDEVIDQTPLLALCNGRDHPIKCWRTS